jgi:hypothetical protein
MSHTYSLQLLREAIEKAPKAFPEERRSAMLAEHARLAADSNVALSQIEDAIVAFGKEIWPYRKAYQEIHDAYGKDEPYLRETLSPATRTKYGAFVAGGGKLEDVRGGGELERTFTPEEKHEIEEAWLAARERAHRELDALIAGEWKQKFESSLAALRGRQAEIEKRIAALRALAGESPKWAAEILDKVKVFEEGWSGVEREVSEDDIRGEIDYYHGVIEVAS